MNEDIKIIKDQLDKTPKILRDYALSNAWDNLVNKIGTQFTISEEKLISLKNEIFLVLIGLELKDDFTENIKRELEIDVNMAGWIAEDVDKNIFKQVQNEIDSFWKTEIEEKPKIQQNNVGNSFEQIILNQARAMQPARPAEAPNNLPTGNSAPKQEEKLREVHDYNSGSDPYREPLA